MLDNFSGTCEYFFKTMTHYLPAMTTSLFFLLSCGGNNNITLNNDWEWNITAVFGDLSIKHSQWTGWILEFDNWKKSYYANSIIDCANKYLHEVQWYSDTYEYNKNNENIYQVLDYENASNSNIKNNHQKKIDWFTYFINTVENYYDTTLTENTTIINWSLIK